MGWILLYVLGGMLATLALAVGVWRWTYEGRLTFFPFWIINWYYLNFRWKTTLSGPLPVVPGQGAVFICNHRSPLDPSFLTFGCRRQIFWLVAAEYFQVRSLGWMLRALGCIPVNRGGVDTAATKQALRLVQAGKLVGMLPEGRINTTSELLLPGRPGAALVALKARAPVIPCFIEGAPYDGTTLGCLRMRATVHVHVGQPIDMAEYVARYEQGDKEVLRDVTLRFLKELARLAGREDFEPQVAGRRWKHGPEAPVPEPAEPEPQP